MGTGVGMTTMPVIASATRGLADSEVTAASTALNIILQAAASAGTALTALLLTATDGFRTTLLCGRGGAGLMALALPMARGCPDQARTSPPPARPAIEDERPPPARPAFEDEAVQAEAGA
ncbi:hypothetical protein [Streptomyces sp. 2A115]|uniref:hypothetical protein n=1 Tax=Streptomyces sp. 2A115 TaxID=3457439 RepID=UPI003FD4C95B